MPEHEDITGVGNLHESKCALYDASGNTIISSDGSEIFIAEQASAAADVAGFGQLWMKTATPNEFWFTNDAGTDYEVALKNTGGVLQLDAGIRQTFAPNSTNAGINVGSVAGDPSTPSNGDLWYDSTANELTARINGANVALGAGGSGASAALDNLASVAINTSLISDTDATDDLGSASIAWKRLYLQAGAATDIPINVELASAHSANAIQVSSTGTSSGDLFHVKSSGAISLPAGSSGSGNWAINFPQSGIYQYSTLGLVLSGAGGLDFAVFSGRVAIPGDDQYTWGATGDPTGTSDVGLSRSAAGVVKVTDGSTGDGELLVGGAKFIGKTTTASTATTTEFPSDGDWGFHEDTTGPTIYVVWNDGGTIRTVALA